MGRTGECAAEDKLFRRQQLFWSGRLCDRELRRIDAGELLYCFLLGLKAGGISALR